MATNLREDFLKSVKEDSPAAFLRLIEQHNSRNEPFDVGELLQTLPKKDHESLWTGLRDMTQRLILANPLSSQGNVDLQDEHQSCQWSALLSFLEGVTTVALCALATAEKTAQSPAPFLETAIILHGLLMLLPEEAKALQNNISQLCELWIVNDLSGKEELVTNTVPFVIIRSLGRGTAADVKCVWSLRQCLLVIDFEDNSSASLKQVLHQCMIHPMYLKLEEGRRFLSFLFGLNPELSKEFHKTIKNQIPYCAVNSLRLYGEVYFRAWRVASGVYLKVLEENCIQDLMYCAVHAQRSGTQSMASRLRKVLEYFHKQKKQRGVDEALLRLYQPIIWRAFKAANPMVRANAAALLTDTFPLQNPDAGNEEIDALLQTQFDILKNLLEDPCPTVRATAIHGVCRVTGVFWELIPAHVIKMFLTTLITELAFDTSSSAVRVAVFQGLKVLLDNRLSHPLLKTLLVHLQDLVHDSSEKVRIAFLDVLLFVKGLKAIKFWNIVPLEQLLCQLEVEQSASVTRRLVKLLVNSFHPTSKGPDIQVSRCLALWKSNPVASRKFYQYVHLHSTLSATGKFMLFLCQYLVKFAKREGDENTQSFESEDNEESMSFAEDKENVENLEDNSDACDVGVIAGLVETIAICWGGIKDKLDQNANEATKTKLVEKFSKALPKLFGSITHPRVQGACLVIAGFLPSSALPAFSAKCLSSLFSLPATALSTEYGPLLNCLCAWNQVTEVLQLIEERISAGMSGTSKSSRMEEGKKRKKKSVTFQLPLENKHTLSLSFLSWLMSEPTCRTAVQERSDKLRQIAVSLRLIMATIESRLASSESPLASLSPSDEEFFQKAFQAYCLIEIHLHHMEKNEEHGGAMVALEYVLVWADRVLLPAMNGNLPVPLIKSGNTSKRLHDESQKSSCLIEELVKIILTCLSETTLLGIAQEKFYNQAAVFTTSLANLGYKAVEFLPQLAKLVYQVAHSILFSDVCATNFHLRGGPVSIILKNLLEILASCDTPEVDVLPQALQAVRRALSEVLLLTEVWKRRSGANLSLMSPLLSAVVTNIKQQISTAGEETSEDALPLVAAFLVKLITSSQALLKSFMSELKKQVLSGELSDAVDTKASVARLLAALHGFADASIIKTCALQIAEWPNGSDAQTSEDVKEAQAVIQKMLVKLEIVV
ncbi:condensin-2 complex subunit G2-like [Acropora millepora]|uniref:condensin-2 complex subunit G2-like n=1 Tax=Acropora millepora TaxID=45264 RepID=UPI001CF434AA|nr:condensin-2 complex subunit G2-like [Acropora millepora]